MFKYFNGMNLERTILLLSIILFLFVSCGDSPTSSKISETAPYLSSIPDQLIIEDMMFDTIYLNNYVSDIDTEDSLITWTYRHNSNLNVEITNNIAVITTKSSTWYGTETIVFRATDPDNQWDEKSINFTVEKSLYKPLEFVDMPVSTPLEQGLDPYLLQNTYKEAEDIDHIYSYLIIKNNYLVAERYFNGKNVNSATPIASATKSFVSALMGIALREGFVTDLDQLIKDYFPEYDSTTMDPRKGHITIRHMLQMRSGFPDESSGYFYNLLINSPNWLYLLVEFPLLHDAGTVWAYSNLSAYTIGVILSMATNMSLKDFCNIYLLNPIGTSVNSWPKDQNGYYYGSGDMNLTGRDMVKFGLLIKNNGVYNGEQIIPSDWIEESTSFYSYNMISSIGSYFRYPDYGYFWWGARVGKHNVTFAAGSGGNFIVLIPDLNMIVVTTALPRNHPYLSDTQLFNKIADLIGEYIKSI